MQPYTFADWAAGVPFPKSGFDAADCVENGWDKNDLDRFMRLTANTHKPKENIAQGEAAHEVAAPSSALREPHQTDTKPSVGGQLDNPLITRRPVIKYIESELPKIVTYACEAAVASGALLYGRGTALMRPVTIPLAQFGKGLMRSEGATTLVPVDKPALIEIMTEVIDWRRFDKRIDDWKPIACPAQVAETILARRGDWPFPQLNAVVTCPTMRPDGTIISEPGFDRQTGILFASELNWPKVEDHPTKASALTAIASLRDLISDFPFPAASDQAAALAMIMTAVIRPCLPASPMFGVSAPTPGTGKSKLVDIAAILATGQCASVLSAAREEAEMQKQIGAALMAGDPFITLDNIEYPLRSEFLCQTLTQGNVTVRVLGESRTVKLPTGATFCATGNSLRFAGDLTRRVVLINLDARMERPEDRVFDHDVVAVAKARRKELVMAVLTMLRAFIVQRGPKIVPALGSFETWSNLVRSALLWLGEADPLANAEVVRENDPERERTAAILSVLPATTFTASEIGRLIQQDRERTTALRQHEALADALSEFIERTGTVNAVRLGHFLRKQKDRIINGRRIVSAGKDRTNTAQWRVEEI